MKLGIINFHDMNIEKMQMFFDSKPGSFQPICGIIIANKSFSSAKAALVCSFRASGKNCRENPIRCKPFKLEDLQQCTVQPLQMATPPQQSPLYKQPLFLADSPYIDSCLEPPPFSLSVQHPPLCNDYFFLSPE